ncbi:EamA-like transporter family protein [Paenibacillus konkukensis]|uniref:EamA-like transporter family protein n=1 Tax=Paenibacillus konkukensis TaxID=2020716 RepID=A0ABY4RZF4_9BACL|nr:DMT family transporter [Paenibacillus konkukensis]UQZ87681.1 EamA-like transporter family protein [Paenibacillus konkukensis]
MERTLSSQSSEHAGAGTRSGVWLIALGAALWGVDPLFRILLLKFFTSSQIVLLEHVLLMVYSVPVLWIYRKTLKGLTWKHIAALLFISWGGSAIATIMFTSAFAHGNLNGVLLLQKLQPLFAILMARWILKELLPGRFFIVVIMALAGTYLLTFGASFPFDGASSFGVAGGLLSIGAAALWGGSTVMGRLLLDKMPFETVTALRFLLALPLLLATTWVNGDSWHWPAQTGDWFAVSVNLLLQAFLPGLLSLLLYYRGLSGTKASYATLAELFFPAVGVLVNWVVFHQGITFAQIVGFVLIWFMLFYLSRQQDGKSVASAAVQVN